MFRATLVVSDDDEVPCRRPQAHELLDRPLVALQRRFADDLEHGARHREDSPGGKPVHHALRSR
eukprot:13357489-Heterocapsa_arctica.AAC.1